MLLGADSGWEGIGAGEEKSQQDRRENPRGPQKQQDRHVLREQDTALSSGHPRKTSPGPRCRRGEPALTLGHFCLRQLNGISRVKTSAAQNIWGTQINKSWLNFRPVIAAEGLNPWLERCGLAPPARVNLRAQGPFPSPRPQCDAQAHPDSQA